ncbi:putative para-hydroxybenzoate-polyprenyltransferase, mitochondrial [Venustampulla echinocandica]|uniref:4-hydroxybenzoate polyprenyltransferase, mitochondrial n=1 Tax=Venustampulla echinocandica TaxID=2656787 RepID=A0A370TU47_9HELO|nr:putative para-hydroxybenzoate-polyprenyltransferase, mitochondrial [Venustampulla echinocandica]RDL39056.1 putative para-hydroxybenzoate-polyprenyltransferase, mitochondrial [Venustampulla echinocandica]
MSARALFKVPSSCQSTRLRLRSVGRFSQFSLRRWSCSSRISIGPAPRLQQPQPQLGVSNARQRYLQHFTVPSNRVTGGAEDVAGSKPSLGAGQESITSLPQYEPPTTGILSKLPSSWVPYAELTRLDKPTGIYYLYFPCLFSTLLAAPLAVPIASPLSVVGTSLLFFSGALLLRSAGCAINDLWDRNLDPHVARTRLRPIARRAITPFNAVAFTGAQLLVGLGILLQFPYQCLFYGIASLPLVVMYPLAKRVTYYPQFVLGLTFSWGAIMGFPALGVDLLHNNAALTAAACLYTSNIAWTVLYDMIYAHMDIKDDAKAGIKSIALRHDAQTKQILSGLAVTQVGLLAAAGAAVGASPVFFIGSCGGAAVTLSIMIKKVNLKSVKDCWWWFVNGCLLTGGVISTGLGAEYVVQYSRRTEDMVSEEESVQLL